VSEPFIGEIRMFGFNFAPNGWAMCNGQLLAISQNTALFSLLGTYYGGNGTSNFALPDFRGRVPLHQGQGSGLSSYVIGEVAGTETVTLSTAQLPSHTHGVQAGTDATTKDPTGSFPGFASGGAAYTGTGGAAMAPAMVGSTGSGQPVPNIQPLLVVTFCIALFGIFPSRN